MFDIRLILIMAVTVFGSGCSFFDNPYAGFKVGDIDEAAAQAKASILVGDPQVISRETLINDRMRELDHLNGLIEKSENETFEPQLRRDLSVNRSLALQLGISRNTAAGDAFERNQDIEAIKAEIELLKLRNELKQLESKAESEPQSTDLDPSNTVPGIPEGIAEPTVTAIQEQLDAVIKSAKDKLDALNADTDGKRARASQITASPEDNFEDLNAYRARLRQRESEVRLDDVHDANGNTLYRIQFNTTLLPGKIKNKYGVLDLEIGPPEISQSTLRDLYDFWLTDLMFRGVSATGDRTDWERVQSLLLQNDLVERIVLDYKTESGEQRELILFTKPEDNQALINVLSVDDKYKDLIHLDRDLQKFKDLKTSDRSRLELQSTSYVRAFRSISAIEIFLSSLERDPNLRSDIPIKYIIDIKDKLFKAVQAANFVNRNNENIVFEVAPSPVPPAFVEKMSRNGRWAGEAYSYQSQPTSRVQRLSSLASAANSMQMAISLASTQPGNGVGLNAGVGAGRTAVGMVDAIERSPLVVGYTDRGKVVNAGKTQAPADSRKPKRPARFGYVFGPKAVLDADNNRLEYRQLPASHAVYSDISVPSWWPELELKIRRAWVENWHEGESLLQEDPHDSTITVRLRPNRFGIDQLTRYLIEDQLIGIALDEAKIHEIHPKRVSACADRIEFLVRGDNLWRNASTYLRGKRHDTLSVLPDMKGIVVSFNIRDLPKKPDGDAREKLIVWTSFGKAPGDIWIVNTINGKPCPGSLTRSSAAISTKHTRHINVNPPSRVRVDLDQPLPAAAREIQVIARLDGFDTEGTYAPTGYFPGKYYEADIRLAPNPIYKADSLAGASLHLGLSYKLTDFGPRERKYASRRLVFYSDGDSAGFKLETTAIDGLGDRVTLGLPKKFDQAYPNAVRHKSAFSASIAGHDKVPVDVVADWNKVTGKVVLKMSPAGRVAQADLDKFKDAHCKGDLDLALGITPHAGRDFPGKIVGSLKLKKTSSGCR